MLEYKELLIPITSFAAGCAIVALFVHSPIVLALLAVAVAAFAAGIAVSKFLLKAGDPYQPKAMFHGQPSYVSPDVGYVLLQSAMSRMGLVEERDRGGQ